MRREQLSKGLLVLAEGSVASLLHSADIRNPATKQLFRPSHENKLR